MPFVFGREVCTLIRLLPCAGVEISDEEAEKIFTCKDAIELLKSKLHLK